MLKALAAILAFSGSIIVSASPVAGERGEVHILTGKVFLDGQELVDNLSLVQTHFRFLFFYIPGTGLVTVSNKKFDGGEKSGFFDAGLLEVSFGGHELRLKSASAILGPARSDAWVSFDPAFALNSKGLMFGYGDDLGAPQNWQKYVDNDR